MRRILKGVEKTLHLVAFEELGLVFSFVAGDRKAVFELVIFGFGRRKLVYAMLILKFLAEAMW